MLFVIAKVGRIFTPLGWGLHRCALAVLVQVLTLVTVVVQAANVPFPVFMPRQLT